MRIVDLSAELNLSEVDSLLASDVQQNIDKTVHEIIEDIRSRGDEALCDYTKRFDEFELVPELMRVPEEDIQWFASDADDELVEILRQAAKNIREFHEQQTEDSWECYAGDGIRLGVRQTPNGRAGIYIPGGKAAYPVSSVSLSLHRRGRWKKIRWSPLL